ncbi:MAG: sterol carrier protein [Peptococcaceae bacterium]|nr:sterol carrier protein [Peptococcaceae bacterium]
MATHEEIKEALEDFTENFNNNERLRLMNKDWNRVVVIKATDVDSTHSWVLQDGHLTLQEGLLDDPDLTVSADSETLADVFYGDVTPIEPYNDGTLRIIGTEDDITRLDFICLMIWGE